MRSNGRMAAPLTSEWVVEVGIRIQRLRSAFKITQTQLAERTGFSTSIINNWESGTHPPSLEKAIILREQFGITLDWLYFADVRGLTPVQITDLTAAKLPAPMGRQKRTKVVAKRRA